MDRLNVTYVYHTTSTFIRKDIEFLKERYEVAEDTYAWENKYLVPFILVAQFFKLLFTTNSKTVYIVMFAGYWSIIPTLFAKVLGRRTYIIVGGTDCTSFPEFNYGSLRKPLIKKAIGYSLKNCTTILPVSEELVIYDYSYFDALEKKQGYKAFFPSIETPFQVVYNGYELPIGDLFEDKRPNSFITVAGIRNPVTYELKGIDFFVEMAKTHSQCEFTIVGISDDIATKFRIDIIPNLTCIPYVGKDELDKLYRKHQFYCCLSLSEGFPNALCEGMSYGCIPIGSKVSAIPFIIGNTGFIVERRDFVLLNQVLRQAIALTKEEVFEKSTASMKRIADSFPLKRRKSSFFNIIGE
ncbi:glycosyltransferase family 4 protein [Bacteroidota bacterium]